MTNKNLLFGILLSIFSVAHAHATAYRFKTIDFPGATSTQPASINASGQVTGNYSGGAFFYNSGTFTNIDLTEGYYCGPTTCVGHIVTVPRSINDLGQVVGYRGPDRHDSPGGFLYSSTSGKPIKLSGYARDINNGGQVVGYGFPFSPKSLLYNAGTYTYLSASNITDTLTLANGINDKGQIAGTYSFWRDPAPQIRHGFVKSGGSYLILDVPNAASTYASSINGSGQVAGFYADATGINHGFVYGNGAFKTFNVPGSIYSSETGDYSNPDTNLQINDNGQVSGTYTDVSGDIHGFVYRCGRVATIDIPNATTTFVNDINASGQLTGYYIDSVGTHGFIATPILFKSGGKHCFTSSNKHCEKSGWKTFGFKPKGECRRHNRKSITKSKIGMILKIFKQKASPYQKGLASIH